VNQSIPGLTTEQKAQYWDNGFLRGVDVLTVDQMALARQKLIALEASELAQDPEQWARDAYQPWSEKQNPWWHWFRPMCTHPTIIGAVKSLLGPDVLIRNADIFIKPANSAMAIGWHVDTASTEKSTDKMLTAWFSISDSTPDNGCMEWLPTSHHMVLPEAVKDKETLTFIDEARNRANLSERAANVVHAGQLSLHHFRTAHRSGGNFTDIPRIGLVIRFMAADCDPEVAESGKAFLAAGNANKTPFSLAPTFPVHWNRSPFSEITP
jgi:ectoine hydroxylase-related dioxygenase (phytanoyl-CoA dioxygenase family)